MKLMDGPHEKYDTSSASVNCFLGFVPFVPVIMLLFVFEARVRNPYASTLLVYANQNTSLEIVPVIALPNRGVNRFVGRCKWPRLRRPVAAPRATENCIVR